VRGLIRTEWTTLRVILSHSGQRDCAYIQWSDATLPEVHHRVLRKNTGHFFVDRVQLKNTSHFFLLRKNTRHFFVDALCAAAFAFFLQLRCGEV
jgi:hypothetical protein